ncbi:MAG: restriction endonuclease subunit S [Enterococcus cecorum]|nr:restriction endonuclease subunit S [Enterococcus cecorum]
MVAHHTEWKECIFKDTGIEVLKGQIITRDKAKEGEFPVVAGGKEPAYHCDKYNRDGFTVTISASGANAGYVNLYKGKIFASDCSTISEAPNYDIRYIYYLLLNKQSEIYDAQTGGAQPHIHPKDIYKIPIIFTSDISEQQAIASTLSDFDEHIDNLTKLIEKKKAIRDGALEDLVSGKTRLDGFDGEWEEKCINDFIKIQRGASPRPIEYYLTNGANGVNWIKIGDAPRYGKYIETTEERITQSGANHSVMVYPDDFILSNSMSFGRPYILKVKGCIHDGWLRLYDFQENADRDFLFYLLSSQNVQSQYAEAAAGSGVQNLNKEVVKGVKVVLPSVPEQQAIAQVLIAMDEEIESLEAEKSKVIQIREGAMDDLLTGRVRLKI